MSPISLFPSYSVSSLPPPFRPARAPASSQTEEWHHLATAEPITHLRFATLSPPQAPDLPCGAMQHQSTVEMISEISPKTLSNHRSPASKTSPDAMRATAADVLTQLEQAADGLISLGGDQLQALYMLVLHSANSSALRGHQALMETMSRLRAQAARTQKSILADAHTKLRAVYETQTTYERLGGGLRLATLAMSGILLASSAGLGPAFLLMAASACLGAGIGAAVQGNVREGHWSKEGALTGAETGVSLAIGVMGLGGVLAGAAKAQQVISRAPQLASMSQAVRAFGQGMLEGLGRWAAPLGGMTAELASASHVSSMVVGLPAAAVTQVGNLKVNLGTRDVQCLQADAKHLELMMTGLGNMLRSGTQFTTLVLRCHEQAMQKLLQVNDQRHESTLRIARNTAH